jgi:hypothetical protein
MPSVVQATKATFSSPVGDLPSSYSQGRRGSLMWKCFRRPHSILLRSMKRNKEINLIKRRYGSSQGSERDSKRGAKLSWQLAKDTSGSVKSLRIKKI